MSLNDLLKQSDFVSINVRKQFKTNKNTCKLNAYYSLSPHTHTHTCIYVIHAALNDETKHLIGREQISLMKPTSFLINTARGGIINEKELIQCMKDKLIAGAGLDTQEVEPPSDDCELYTLDNVFVTPHIGWRRLETRQRLVDMTVDNIKGYIDNKPINVVNSE